MIREGLEYFARPKKMQSWWKRLRASLITLLKNGK